MDCLEERNREQSAGYNELALSLLDVVGALGAGGCFSVQHHAASLFRLVRALAQLLSPQLRREAPLKLRAAAAEALEKLAAARQLAPVLLPCLGERAHCFFAIPPSLRIFHCTVPFSRKSRSSLGQKMLSAKHCMGSSAVSTPPFASITVLRMSGPH